MSKTLLLLIDFYQNIISVILRNVLGISNSCRSYPTCSNYAKESIEKYGAIKGGIMTFSRVVKCQPFISPQYDRS